MQWKRRQFKAFMTFHDFRRQKDLQCFQRKRFGIFQPNHRILYLQNTWIYCHSISSRIQCSLVLTAMKIFLFAILLNALFSASKACRCVNHFNIEHYYCSSDFLVGVEVTSERQSNASIDNGSPYYALRVRHIFKANDTIREVLMSDKRVWTSPNSCGVWLNPYHDYILSGSLWNNKLNIFGCDFVRSADSLDEEQKKFLYQQKYESIECPNKS